MKTSITSKQPRTYSQKSVNNHVGMYEEKEKKRKYNKREDNKMKKMKFIFSSLQECLHSSVIIRQQYSQYWTQKLYATNPFTGTT